MLVRLAFAVIAHVDADILVIDEALAVGDAFFTQKCMRFLREFMLRGTTIYVSHDIGSIQGLCNKALWLDKGAVVKYGSAKEVCESYIEAIFQRPNQIDSAKILNAKLPVSSAKDVLYDQRRAFINAASIRNDIQIIEFDPGSAGFGDERAQIIEVALLSDSGEPLSWVVGGEHVSLHVRAVTKAEIDSPLVGFFLKDRLGQVLFGDNTYLSYLNNPLTLRVGVILVAQFRFQMPRLPIGDYSMTVAIASGSQRDPVQHHWIHDALFFRSESSSVSSGLIGIPMSEISLIIDDPSHDSENE